MSGLLRSALGDERFAVLAVDPVAFVRAFDREPWPYQAEDLRTILRRGPDGKFERRVAVASMPRQDGKSTLSGWAALHQFFTNPEIQMIVSVALDRESAHIILNDARRIVSQNEVLFDLVDPAWGLTKSSIRLRDGRNWLIKSADGRFSRGLRPSIVLFDELGWSKDDGDLFQVLAAGQAAQPNPLMIVTSTVGPVQAGPLWELFESARRGDPDVRLIYRNENLSPLVSDEYLAGERRRLPPSVYAREHENLWSSGTDAFCNYDAWERAVAGGSSKLQKFPGPAYMYVDLGLIHDETAIAVAARGDKRVEVIGLDAMRGSKGNPLHFDRIKRRIHQMVKRLGVTQIKIESPQGYAMAQELARELQPVEVQVVHPTAKIQNELWGNLHGALRDGTVHIPKDELLRRQLLSLTIKQSLTGWRVVDVPSIHQDRAIAVGGAALMASGDGIGFFEFLAGEGYGEVASEPGKDDNPLAPVLTRAEMEAADDG